MKLIAPGVVVILIGLLIRLAPVHIVAGNSMAPTYKSGQVLSVDRHPQTIQRGDVVVIRHLGDTLLKRVYALPGDTFFVILDENGETDSVVNWSQLVKLQAAKRRRPHSYRLQRVILGTDEIYLLGDNLNNSEDSRCFGVISTGEIIARVRNAKVPATVDFPEPPRRIAIPYR